MSRNFQGVGTGKFKTGCRRRKVIKEDFAGVPIRWFCFRLFNLESWRAPVQGPGSLLGKFYVLTTYTMWLPSSRLCSIWWRLSLTFAWITNGSISIWFTWKRIPKTSQALIDLLLQWLTRVVFLRVLRFPPTNHAWWKKYHAWFFNTKERIWIKREYKKRTNRKIIKIKKIFCNI